jgi:nucleotide-binding universal stress UspA family protein
LIATLMQVLGHLDSSPASRLRLQAACEVAGQHGAALAAEYAVSSTIANMPYGEDASGASAATMAKIDDRRRAARRVAIRGSRTGSQSVRRHGRVGYWSSRAELTTQI